MRINRALAVVFGLCLCLPVWGDTLSLYTPDHPLYPGQRYLQRKQYLNAADFYRRLSRKYPGTSIGLEAAFLEAESHRLAGRYRRAIDAYRRLQQEYAFAPKVQEAQYRIAWCYAQQRTEEAARSAVAAVDLLLLSFPETLFKDQALALREEALSRQKIVIEERTAKHEAVFERAREHFAQKKYIDAMEGFRDVIYNNPGTRLAAEATFYLGECYFRTKDYAAAQDEYQRLLDDYPNSPWADDAQYMLAYSLFKQSPHWALDQKDTGEKARTTVARFFERFPDSPLAPEVKQLQAKVDEKLARKEFEAGRIYYKMKNYKSARIYFNYVVDNYADTSWATKAREYLRRLGPEPSSSPSLEDGGRSDTGQP